MYRMSCRPGKTSDLQTHWTQCSADSGASLIKNVLGVQLFDCRIPYLNVHVHYEMNIFLFLA